MTTRSCLNPSFEKKKWCFQIFFHLPSFAEFRQDPQGASACLKLCFIPRAPSQLKSWTLEVTGRSKPSASSFPNPYIARLCLVGKLREKWVKLPLIPRPPAELIAFPISWSCEERRQFTCQDHGSYSSMLPPSSFTSLGNYNREAFCLNLSTKLNIGI